MASIIQRWLANRIFFEDAVRRGKLSIVRVKLESGVSFNELNECIHYAEHRGLAMVKLLVEHGADVNHKPGGKRRSPLHLAASSGYIEIADYLIARGAQVNAVDDEGDTPLDCAFLQPFPMLFVQLGAAPALPDDEQPQRMAVAELLIKYGAKGGHLLPSHLWGPIKSQIRVLIPLARMNFPSAASDAIADRVLERIKLTYDPGTPSELKVLVHGELRELVLTTDKARRTL